ARHVLQATVARGLLELGHTRYAQLVVQAASSAWTDAWHLQQRGQRDRKIPSLLLVELHTAGCQVLDDLGFQSGADARQLAQATLLKEGFQSFVGVADATRRRAVGLDAVRRLTLELEDVPDLGKQARDFGVGVGSRLVVGHPPLA